MANKAATRTFEIVKIFKIPSSYITYYSLFCDVSSYFLTLTIRVLYSNVLTIEILKNEKRSESRKIFENYKKCEIYENIELQKTQNVGNKKNI